MRTLFPLITAVFAQYYTFIQTIIIFRRRRPALDLTILARYHILSLLYLICCLLWWTSCSRQTERCSDIFHNRSRHLEAELSGFHPADVFTKSVCAHSGLVHMYVDIFLILFTHSFFCGVWPHSNRFLGHVRHGFWKMPSAGRIFRKFCFTFCMYPLTDSLHVRFNEHRIILKY